MLITSGLKLYLNGYKSYAYSLFSLLQRFRDFQVLKYTRVYIPNVSKHLFCSKEKL